MKTEKRREKNSNEVAVNILLSGPVRYFRTRAKYSQTKWIHVHTIGRSTLRAVVLAPESAVTDLTGCVRTETGTVGTDR